MVERVPELIEPTVMQVDFCDGMAAVEVDRNGIARLVWYREHREVDGTLYRHVAARMLMPHAAMIEAAGLMLTAKCAGHDVVMHDAPRREMN